MTYDTFPMPPMPPAPQDMQVCAATVRHVIAFARRQPDARVCLAPEGRDSGDGSLIAPPSGAGRFILQLCRADMTILPIGVCEDGGAWYVRFGSTFTLALPGGLSTDERDEWFNRDPLDRFAAWLTKDMAFSSADLAEVKARVTAQIDEAVEKAKQAPLPTANDLCTDVFA
jgi:hypothetical protein